MKQDASHLGVNWELLNKWKAKVQGYCPQHPNNSNVMNGFEFITASCWICSKSLVMVQEGLVYVWDERVEL